MARSLMIGRIKDLLLIGRWIRGDKAFVTDPSTLFEHGWSIRLGDKEAFRHLSMMGKATMPLGEGSDGLSPERSIEWSVAH